MENKTEINKEKEAGIANELPLPWSAIRVVPLHGELPTPANDTQES